MNAELYIVPIGIADERIVSSVEVYVPDLDMIIAPGNSTLLNKDEAAAHYENQKKVADIEIEEEESKIYKELQASVALHMQCEEKALSALDPLIVDAIKKFQAEPHIHIPTADETSAVMGDSGIILEG